MLRIQPDQDVAHHERAEEIFHRSEEALVQVVAQLFQTERRWPSPAAPEIFSSTGNPLLRAAPTAMAAKLLLWQETQAAFGTKFASAR